MASISFDNVPLGTHIPSSDEVTGLTGKVATLGEAFGSLMANYSSSIAAAETKYRKETRELVPTGQARENMNRDAIATVNAAAERAAQRKLGDYRKLLLSESEAHRTDMLRQMDEAVGRLTILETLYPSPLAMLSAAGLGSVERSRYHEQLANAGSVELTNYARRAIATNDRLLAAAVLARLDSMPREARPFSASDFAEKIVGKEHETLIRNLQQARLTRDATVAADKELRTGKNDSIGKIARGLRAQQLRDNSED